MQYFTQMITTLDLYYNQIGVQGSQHLANALKQNTVKPHTLIVLFIHYYLQTLTTLDLSHNKIGNQGVQYLANALQHNKVTSSLSRSIIHRVFHSDTHHTKPLEQSNL
jgi:Ran GTPase-activating protein (RanGAP) involved in mRNA processing and transport